MAGYVYPGQRQNQQKSNPNEWEKMLAQARMAMMMDGQTALGMALGKLIRDGWLSYKANKEEQKLNDYRNRGLNTSSQPQSYDFHNPINDMIARYQPPTEKNPTESIEIQSTDYLPGMGSGYQLGVHNILDDPSSPQERYKRDYLKQLLGGAWNGYSW